MKKYPYLAKNVIDDKTYVVLFSEENYGTIVMSEIDNNVKLSFGTIGDFDESVFEILPPDIQVSMHN